jgi:hypothetical protein
MTHSILPYVIPLLLVVLILRRSGRPRGVNPKRMWISPLIFSTLALSALVAEPFPGFLALLAFLAAAVLGAGLGYLRALHQNLTIDPKTGKISSQATTLGSFLILALFVVRFGLKLAFPGVASHGHTGADVTLGTSILLVFTVAMMVTQTVLIWSRTRPLLAAHAAGTLRSTPTSD